MAQVRNDKAPNKDSDTGGLTQKRWRELKVILGISDRQGSKNL